MYNFSEFKKVSDSTVEWLKKEYTSIRTGRAMPSILDRVSVSAYGSSVPINQLATVSVEDPKTLRLTVWDKNAIKDIDKAIRESNLGLSVAVDASGLRVSFPELTSERRMMLSKVAKEKFEEARVAVRTEREKTLNRAGKDLSEDDKFRLKTELQKLVDEVNKKLEELFTKKETEISE
ncbi:MAG: ribosome recycling factor [Candidatus Zambryskibacteria bacterium RIFCSPHIGHO2_01_FULL_44_22b]|uniref:Ribosome recycling factor n=2 Tax=Candidatus Zambryskiibacteriota TaxID=1817925 RepID=A0A1G2SXV3_9BACT|nr:MAG: ribosome recycling factor [Candidatus Zambryskibacteria bacterium RIFCSPHIGHO2_01_FULL_44_22b]OHB04894.1 MAG: ribosome recycling factor [Candidatus Zambryskibacteria bacterium RIFCSPLOWO2_01_FULL_45_43]